MPLTPQALLRVDGYHARADLARDHDPVAEKRKLRLRRAPGVGLQVEIAALAGNRVTLCKVAEVVRREAELPHRPRQLALICAAENQFHRLPPKTQNRRACKLCKAEREAGYVAGHAAELALG